MKRKSLSLINIALSTGLLALILLFTFFIWRDYFLSSSPVSLEEEEISSFLQVQSIKKSADLMRKLSQLTVSSPSANLKRATTSAEVKGEKTSLSVEIINLSGQKRAGLIFKETLEDLGFEVKSLIDGQISPLGIKIYFKPSVSEDSLFLIEEIFQNKVKIIDKEASLPLNFFVDIRILLGR